MKGIIFISYRRDDDAGFVGRIYDHLTKSFSAKRLFIDVQDIVGGEDYPQLIDSKVSQSDVLLLVIGKRWLSLTDDKGQRRIDDNTDLHRLEIQSALNGKIRIIPVLLDGATIPTTGELPAELAPLATKQAVRLAHNSFLKDFKGLVASIKAAIREAEIERAYPSGRYFALSVAMVSAIAVLIYGEIAYDWRLGISLIFLCAVGGFFLFYYILDMLFSRHIALHRWLRTSLLWFAILAFYGFLASVGGAMVAGEPEFAFELLGMPPVRVCHINSGRKHVCGGGDGTHAVTQVAWYDTDGGLNVREKPNYKSARLGTIAADVSNVSVQQCIASWCQITCGALKGWSNEKWLRKTEDVSTQIVNISPADQDGLTARGGPSSRCAATGQMPHNAQDVIVHSCQHGPEDNANWCHVTYQGFSGWVLGEYIANSQVFLQSYFKINSK